METQTNTAILKAAALKQYNGEDFFLLLVDDEWKAYEGTEEEAKKQYKEDEDEDKGTFEEWVNYNLIEIDPIEEDEETDGYMVLTEEEADEKAAEYIKDSLWAFNASFIIEHSKLPYDAEEMVKTFQEQKCESANSTIEALIEDMDQFIEDAISADGRGHFLNTYDGQENEETVEGHTFYIYRMS